MAPGWRREVRPGVFHGIANVSCSDRGGGDPKLPSTGQVVLNTDGTLQVISGSSDVGQGQRTLMSMLAAETLGIPLEQTTITAAVDTAATTDTVATAGSWQMVNAGWGIVEAATDARRQLLGRAAGKFTGDARQKDEDLDVTAEDLDIHGGFVFLKSDRTNGRILAGDGKREPMMRRAMFLSLAVMWLGVACAPAPGSISSGSSDTGGPSQSGRTLVVAVQTEPITLSGRTIAQGGASQQFPKRLFNADLALLDDQSNPLPYLSEALPQLNTDSWKVFPDGRMETTYRLRPNLVWHDGRPHTADDFVFSWQLFATPELGSSSTLPISLISSVEAPDNGTVVIRWTEPNAVARGLQSLGSSGGSNGLPPLPRSILASALAAGVEVMINHSYWNQEYVGLGPYRLDRWEPGAFIEASAFDRHVLGAPKIQRIKILFFTDPGAALAAMLAGDAHLATDSALTAFHAVTLMRQWPAGSGYQVPYYGTWVAAHFQGRPEMVSPPALQDRRVRQALAYAVDRPSLNDAIYEGQYLVADSSFAPTSELGKAADAAAVRYSFDLARSGQLMAEAGFTRLPAAEFYISPGGERFSLELKSSDGQDEALRTAMASTWRQSGFDAREAIIASRLARELETKSQFPGLYIGATSEGERGVGAMSSGNIPTAQNNWRGSGVGFAGYSNPELDRLVAAFGRSLDLAERSHVAADIARLWSTELPAIHLFFTMNSQLFSSDVKGPRQRPASSSVHWNIHEWELR